MTHGFALVDQQVIGVHATYEEAKEMATNWVKGLYESGLWNSTDKIFVGKFNATSDSITPSAEEAIEEVNGRIHYEQGNPNYFKPTEEQTQRLQTLLSGAFRQWMDDCHFTYDFGDLSEVETYVFDGQQLRTFGTHLVPGLVGQAVRAASEAHKSLNAEV